MNATSYRRTYLRGFARQALIEHLESRINLAGDCLFEPSAEGDADRAARAVNCFAVDLYEHFQREQGNVLISPLSIATGLAMTYAGAAGETAAQMSQVLHLGTEPGVHASFRALLSSFNEQAANSELEVANALWPRADLDVRDEFLGTIRTEYGGEAQSLDFSIPDEAEEVINSWVEEKTRGRIKNLVDGLSPLTAMVLTNSIYMKALWEFPFDPNVTDQWVEPKFYRDDGQVVESSMMYTQAKVPLTVLNGFQVLELPFEGGMKSMVLLLPQARTDANELTPETIAEVNQWLASPREIEDFGVEVVLPKFSATASSKLETLLSDMGMPLAFGNADFSLMTESQVYIDQVTHKANLAITEQGIEASAATEVELLLCFAAGTPVVTQDGEKPIEQIKAGDYVLSRSDRTVEGEIRAKLVEETFHGHAEVVNLHVGGEIIRVTKGHRFFVKGQGWTPAGEMHSGDLLATDLRSWMEVEQVCETGEVEPVYNFRVFDHHTYFVGGESWGFAVWTHNLYGDGFYADRPFHFFIRDNASTTILFMGRITDPTQAENDLTPAAEPIPGDSNGDRRFNSSDLVLAFEFGKYEDGIAGNANFQEGDWNDDGDFDSSDLVFALQNSVYESAVAARAPQHELNPARLVWPDVEIGHDTEPAPKQARDAQQPTDAIFATFGGRRLATLASVFSNLGVRSDDDARHKMYSV